MTASGFRQGLLHEHCLARVECSVAGAAEQDGEAVTRGIFGEVFVGDGGVFIQPFLRCEFFEGLGKLGVDIGPATQLGVDVAESGSGWVLSGLVM